MKKKNRPWLDAGGVEIPTSQLKRICKSWDKPTWENYLTWHETSRRDALVSPKIYEKKCDEVTQTIFEDFDQSTDQKNKIICSQLISRVSPIEGRILQQIFFHGLTVREVAAVEKFSKTHTHRLKNRALSRLKRGTQGERWDTRRLMRGGDFLDISTIWDRPLQFNMREDRMYDPKKHKEEFSKIQSASFGRAIRELSGLQQRVVYLRFWCDFSIEEIARECRCGVNFIEQILDTAVSRIKRTILRHELMNSPDGGPSCA